MMKMREFRKGSWITLSREAHTLPAGCYRFFDNQDGIILMSLGPEIILGLNYSFWAQWLTPATLTATQPTRLHDFISQYAHNVYYARNNDYVISHESMTFCFMSTTMVDRVNKEIEYIDAQSSLAA